MVKPDVKLNYYAALDLGPDASVDDVKKQYRKLALKYHPDRNPGKEDEYIPKFQAISAAHEVLSDPAIKAKYDADRRRATVSSASATPRASAYGQRGNPYTATSSFQPPPRRTADPTGWTRKPTGASAADRYANFPGPGPTSKQGASNKSSAYDAWSSMRDPKPGANKTAGARKPPPPPPPRGPPPATPPRTREEEIRAGMNYKPAPFNTAAYAHFNQDRPNTASSSTPRRGGFDPSTPGSDERPTASSSYNTSAREREYFPDAGAETNVPPNTASSRPSFTGANRTTSAYPNVGGERTYVSSDDLKRTRSARDAASMPKATESRHRSSSPPKPRFAQPATFTMPDDSDSDSSSSSDPGHGQFGTQPRPKKVPVSRLGKTTAANASATQSEQADDSRPSSQSNMYANSFYYHPDTHYPYTIPEWQEANFEAAQPSSSHPHAKAPPKWAVPRAVGFAMRQRAASSSSTRRTDRAPSLDEDWTFPAQEPLQESYNIVPEAPLIDIDDTSDDFSHAGDHMADMMEMMGHGDGFTMPNGVDGIETPQRPRPTNIDTTFSPSGEAPAFTSSPQTKDFPPTPISRRASPAKRGRPVKSSSSMHNAFTAPSGQASWPDFAFGTAPSEGASSEKQKGTAAPQAATIDDNSDDDTDTAANATSAAADEMDIDQTPPAQSTTARPVAVPPSQWRQAQEMPPPPRRHSTAHSSIKTNGARSRPASSSGMPSLNGLSDMLNNGPTGGLNDLSSLHDNMPFPSQASTAHPTKASPSPTALPSCPTAPQPPQMLSKTTWKDYTAKMLAYLSGPWHDFQTTLAIHNADTLAIEERLLFKGSTGLEARGETSADVSLETYLARCKEQERWAELQAMAFAGHNTALERFARTKLRVRELAENGRLQD